MASHCVVADGGRNTSDIDLSGTIVIPRVVSAESSVSTGGDLFKDCQKLPAAVRIKICLPA